MQAKPMKRVLPAYCFSAPQHLLKFPRGDAGGLRGIFDETDRARRERRAHEDLEDFLFHECVHRELLRQKADAEVVLYHIGRIWSVVTTSMSGLIEMPCSEKKCR